MDLHQVTSMTAPAPQKVVLNTTASCSQPSQQTAGGTQNSKPKGNMITVDPSALLNASHASTSSKPPSSALQIREPQSQAHADLLAFHGIKVRDFAYESTLPPVKAWYKPQIQPGIQSLKRQKTDTDEPGPSSDSRPRGGSISSKKARLERMTTEPDVEVPSDSQSLTSVPARARGFLDIQDFVPPESQGIYSQAAGSPESQPPLPDFDSQNISQDTEPYLDTPMVTPHSSLQFIVADASDIPASQLDSVGSQPPLPDLILSYAELARPHLKDPTGLTGALSPMSSMSSIFSGPPSSPSSHSRPSPPAFSDSTRQMSNSLSPPPVRGASPSVINNVPQRPYYLRKRPTTTKPTLQQSKFSSRTKTSVRSPSLLGQARGHSRLTHQKSMSPQGLRPIRRRAAS